MNIDWSKAPEGTNAYCEGYWLQKVEGEGCVFLMQPVNNGWEIAKFKPWKQDGFVYKKDDLAAQEERERAIDVMCITAGALGEFCTVEREMYGRLYDAGYRKFEIVDA